MNPLAIFTLFIPVVTLPIFMFAVSRCFKKDHITAGVVFWCTYLPVNMFLVIQWVQFINN